MLPLTAYTATRRPARRRRLASRYRRFRRRLPVQRCPIVLAPERNTDPLRGPPLIVDAEIVSTLDDYQPAAPPPKRKRRMPALLVAAIAVLSLTLGVGLTLVLAPLLVGSATITLTPEAHTLAGEVTI